VSKGRKVTTISRPSAEPPTPSPTPATEKRPVIDEKLFKAYELYLSERTRLSAGKQEQSKAYDQTILTYSAGAVALSITFLEKVVKNPNAKGWLYVSWIWFALAMMVTVYGYLMSQKAFEGEIAQLDMRYKQLIGLPAEDKALPAVPTTVWGVTITWLKNFAAIFTPALNIFRAAVKWLNRLAGAFFFFGVICFGWFALENWVVLKQEKKDVATTKAPASNKVIPQRPNRPGTGAVPDPGVLPPINPQGNSSPKGNKQ
jgi:hypothetical protein